jgi:translocation and assembly module TamB
LGEAAGVRRPRLLAAMIAVALLLLLVWTARFRIATALVDRRLTAANVPARYRVTKIGPFLERMEDVSLGNPRHPDLVARRIDVTIGYGPAGPAVRGIEVEGVRLGVRIDANGLHLGALDRLLPKSGGKIALPDLEVTLRDVRLALETPNGAIRVALAGAGNPARHFKGTAQAEADAVRLASCTMRTVRATMAVSTKAGLPRLEGPVRIGGTACPGLALGAGEMRIAATSAATFDRVSARIRPAGFAGTAGPAQFAGLDGTIAAAGTLGHLQIRGGVTFAHLALPDQAAAVAAAGAPPAGLPITPTAMRAASGFARLLRDASAMATFAAKIEGTGASVRVRRLALTGGDGANVIAAEGGGLSWAAGGWRIDTNVASAGGDLPPLRIRVRQAGAGAPLSAEGRLDPYSAGGARIAASQLHFDWDGRVGRFGALVMLDGPLGDGFVRGLAVPVEGRALSDGSFAVNPGCRTVSFQQLRQSAFVFGAATIPVCGRPLAQRSGSGPVRISAVSGPIHLAGRSGTAPVNVRIGNVQMTQSGFLLSGVATTIGDPAQPTRLNVATLDGTFGAGLSGRFAGADGAIANVPLSLGGAEGSWALTGGALAIRGGLQVSDPAAEPRFHPLAAEEVTLDLVGGRVAAAGLLRAPGKSGTVARVTLAHDLGTGSGHADLEVPGITFTPKGLQPDMLTPMTLGVVANVAGTVTGRGRIDWAASGVTSIGTFGTERLDLAAAFGPVAGIKGDIHFTDLLGLVTAPAQAATIAELNPGVSVTNGVVHYQLIGQNRVQVENATFPFAAGTLRLDPAMLDFSKARERRLTFRVEQADAAAFIQQLDFPNISATGTFDGVLPMIFDDTGGRIEQGYIAARGGGTLAYVGELTTAQLGTMGKLAFDALKAIRYSALDISLDGRLEGEMVSKVRFTGIREATADQSLITRLIRNLPFKFNIAIRAPFRGLVGTARAYIDPSLLLNRATIAPKPPIQPAESGDMR